MTLSTGVVMRGRGKRREARWGAVVAGAVLAPGLLVGCTGSDGEGGPEGPLSEAQRTLEETSGVELTIATERLPKGTDGFFRIEGTATGAPAFEGTAEVRVNDITDEIPMVGVDGAVYARLPYTEVFVEIDPAAYGSPDLAELMDPEHGLPGWLAATTDVEETDGGVTGRIPGRVVAELIGSAERRGTFEADYELDDDRLARAEVTGPFYGKADTTYTIDISQYDVNEDITRP